MDKSEALIKQLTDTFYGKSDDEFCFLVSSVLLMGCILAESVDNQEDSLDRYRFSGPQAKYYIAEQLAEDLVSAIDDLVNPEIRLG